MKIHSIDIKKHLHLEDLHLDFTYQSGPKKGQPLDKVCLIGQKWNREDDVVEYNF